MKFVSPDFFFILILLSLKMNGQIIIIEPDTGGCPKIAKQAGGVSFAAESFVDS